VDGVLISVSGETRDTAHIRALGIPVVFFDRVCDDVDAARISTDDFQAGYAAARHLLGAGCRRLLFLTPSENLFILRRRREGCAKALLEKGALDLTVLVCSGAVEQIRAALEKGIDGIVASVEGLGFAAYQACADLGRSIPGDVKVLAFSNVPTAGLFHPSLSTIEQPAFELGQAAATVLFKAIEKGGARLAGESRMIPSVLVPRGSTSTAAPQRPSANASP
jgi:LacI family transcriptional regulator